MAERRMEAWDITRVKDTTEERMEAEGCRTTEVTSLLITDARECKVTFWTGAEQFDSVEPGRRVHGYSCVPSSTSEGRKQRRRYL